MAGIKFDITGNNQGILSSLKQTQAAFKDTAKVAEHEGISIEQMFDRIKQAASMTFAGIGAKEFVQKMVQVRGEYQQLEIAFTTMLQSEEKANELTKQLVKTAATTPFDLKGVAEGAKQLLAYGIAAEDVNETITRLGDIAAGLSLPLNDLVYLYGSTMTQGRMFTMDLRQFMSRGIPMAEELVKQFGVAKNEVEDLVTAGKVSADAVKKAIWGMTEEGSKFGGLMAKQSKSIPGQISNIEDAIDKMFNKIGTDSEGIINASLGGVSVLVENYETVSKVILDAIAVYGVYKGALLATLAIEKILALSRLAHMKQMTLLQLATDILAKKTSVLNSVMMANPYAMLAAIIATMVAAYISFADSTDKVAEAHKRIQKATEDYNAEVAREKAELDNLFNELREAKEGTDEYEEAKQNILDQYGDYLNGLSDEIKSLQDVEGAYNALTLAINKSARARAMSSATQNAYDTYGTDFGSSSNKLYEALEEKVGARKAQYYIEQVRKELDKTGKISKDLRNEIKENFRGTFAYGNSDAWLTGMQNATANLHQEIKEAKAAFGELKDETKKEKEEPKTYTPSQIKSQLKADLDKAKKALDAFDKSSGKYTLEEAEKKRKELSEAVDLAEKKYKEYGGMDDKLSGSSSSKSDGTSQEIASLKETQKNIETERKRSAEDMEARIAEATIAVSRDGAERVRQEREQQNKAELDDIDRQKEDAIRKYVEDEKRVFDQQEKIKKSQNAKYKVRQFDEASVDTSSIAKQYDELKSLTQKRQIQNYAKEQADSMNAYLAEYGTFEQRKLAIAQQYEERIKQAATEGERLALQEQMKAALSAVDTDALKKNIDWAEIFGDMGGMLYDEMRNNLEQLEEYMKSSEFLALGATDQKNIADTANQIRKQIGGVPADFSKLGEQTTRLRQSMLDLQNAKEKEKSSIEDVKQKQEAYNRVVAESKKDLSSYETELKKAKDAQVECSANVKELSASTEQAARDLHDNLGNIVTGIDGLSSGLQSLKSGSLKGSFDGLKTTCSALSTLISGKVGTALSAFANNMGGVIGQIISAGLGLLDVLKDGISSIITSLIDTVLNAVNGILSDILSGEIVTNIVGSIANGLINILDTISFGALKNWVGGNVEDNEKEIEKLSESNELLAQSIEGLSDSIKDNDNTNKQSVEAYKKAVSAQEEWEQNQRNAIQLRAGEYSNTGHGFLGLGGKSSFNHHINEGFSGWDEFNQVLSANGVNKRIGSASDIWNLTPDEMKLLRDFAPKAWMELLDTDGESNPKDLIEAYIEKAGLADSLLSDLNEKMTGYSWDGFKDSYSSLLKDLSSTNEDFAEDIEEKISNAILESLVTAKYQERIKALYKMIADAASDEEGITKDEADAIREANEQIANDMLADRKMLLDLGVISNNSEKFRQEASSKGFQSMGQDTADELNGRFTALQMSGEAISSKMDVVITAVQTLQSVIAERNDNAQEINEMRNLIILIYSSTSNIDERMKKYYERWDSLFVNIAKNVR